MPAFLPGNPFSSWDKNDQNETLIVEELCRVIARAKCFQTCIEAWQAILTVKRIAKSIRDELQRFEPECGGRGATAEVARKGGLG